PLRPEGLLPMPISTRRSLLSRCAPALLGVCALGAVAAWPALSWAQGAAPAVTPTPSSTLPLIVGQGASANSYSVPIQTLLFFTALSFLPAALLMMTGFTRIVIVLSLARQ